MYKLHGYNSREAAETLGRVERLVEYKLRRIRERWAEGSRA